MVARRHDALKQAFDFDAVLRTDSKPSSDTIAADAIWLAEVQNLHVEHAIERTKPSANAFPAYAKRRRIPDFDLVAEAVQIRLDRPRAFRRAVFVCQVDVSAQSGQHAGLALTYRLAAFKASVWQAKCFLPLLQTRARAVRQPLLTGVLDKIVVFPQYAGPGAQPPHKADIIARLSDSLIKVINAAGRSNPKLATLSVAMDVLKELSQFIQIHYPKQHAGYIDILERFGQEVAKKHS